MKIKKIIITSLAMVALLGSGSVVATNTAYADVDSQTTVVQKLSDPQHVTVHVDASLPTQVKNAVNYAIQQWNSTGLVHLQLTDSYQANVTVNNQAPYTDSAWATSINATIKTSDPHVKTLLYTMISLDPDLKSGNYNDADVEHTVTHEMGHALGLMDNYADVNAVMYYKSDFTSNTLATTQLNASDYQNLKLLYGE